MNTQIIGIGILVTLMAFAVACGDSSVEMGETVVNGFRAKTITLNPDVYPYTYNEPKAHAVCSWTPQDMEMRYVTVPLNSPKPSHIDWHTEPYNYPHGIYTPNEPRNLIPASADCDVFPGAEISDEAHYAIERLYEKGGYCYTGRCRAPIDLIRNN